jgi:hypothetical protein
MSKVFFIIRFFQRQPDWLDVAQVLDGRWLLKVTGWPKNTYFCGLFFGVLFGHWRRTAEKYP